MASTKILGYKSVFGFVLPDWVDESLIRLAVIFMLSSAVMLFVLILVVWPKFEEIEIMKSGLSVKQTQLESLKSSKTGFDKLNEQISESTQNLILEAVPRSYSPENAIFALRKIANETVGLSIVSYTLPSGVLFEAEGDKPKTESKGDEAMVKFISYPIRLSVVAPVSSLLSFVDKVEKSLPFGVVSDLGMQEVTKLANVGMVNKPIRMELEVKYFQANLKKVDISKVAPINSEDMKLVGSLEKYSRSSVTSSVWDTPAMTNTTGNLFGF